MKLKNTVFLVKAREHKVKYIENIEDIRLGYVDAVLKKNGIRTQIIDLSFCQNYALSDVEVIKQRLENDTPRLMIFFIDKHPTNGPAFTMELLDELANSNCLFDIHISLYGNTQIAIENFFEHHVDSVILGEEESALSLAKCVINNQPIACATGIAFLDNDGAVQMLPASLNRDLDCLPIPTRYILNETDKVPNSYCASILSSRGCFGKCKYCYLRSKEKYYGLYPLRSRSIRKVVDEIEELYKKGVKDFYFSDDEFLQKNGAGLERVLEFCDEIKKRDLRINYSIYSRSDCITKEVVSALVDTGLYCVFLGVESFSQSVLDRYNKGISVKSNMDAICILKEFNVHIRLGMIMFDMFTTIKELKESIDAIKILLQDKPELIFQSLFFSNVLIPLEGTPAESMFGDIEKDRAVSNEVIQETYARRSRCGLETYGFIDKRVADIYACTNKMANALLDRCIEDENRIYAGNYSDIIASRLLNITSFSVELLEEIYEKILEENSINECMEVINLRIKNYFNDNLIAMD